MASSIWNSTTPEAMLPKAYLAAIGCVVIESTFCENLIEHLIWLASGLSGECGKHFTHSINMQGRLDLLAALMKPMLTDEQLSRFTKIVADIRISNNERNIVVHGRWGTQARDSLQFFSFPPEQHSPALATKKRLNAEPLKMTSDKVQEVANAIARSKQALVDFIAEGGLPWPWPSPRTPP